MKKQTLFDLASMPKMVLVIVMVVMLGTLFGATSYLLKTPKTDLPIVNPIIETQCEIDSDCNLVFTGPYISCNSPEENYECLNVSKDDANAINQNKKRLDAMCPDRFDKYTCKCENGKCEKVKEGLVEEVVIATDKIEYEQGENVKITIKNNSENSIWYSSDAFLSSLNLFGYQGEKWILVPTLPIALPFPNYIYQKSELKSSELITLKYIPIEHIDKSSLNFPKYKISFGYWQNEEIGIGNYIEVYSNEFTIKEKSALDARCGEKVKGIGFCLGQASKTGYEFDSETRECIGKEVVGCSFEIPFKTWKECQDVCKFEPKDKESCEKVGGVWIDRGGSFCNLPTFDSGKECSDSSQCEGSCIAELSSEEERKVEQGTIIYTKGKCTARIVVFGCRPHVDDGKVFGILCMD